MFKINKRVKTTIAEDMVKKDGTTVHIPAGHGGRVYQIETGMFATSAQVRWPVNRVWVDLDPIDGISYHLDTAPGFFEKE